MKEQKVTHRIYDTILKLLEKHPDGIRWTDMLAMIQKAVPDAHPKTVNGCVWKLMQKYPDRVYKPEKGVFRLVKYK